MLAKIRSFALAGIDAMPVEVEVDGSAGLPKTILVGQAETAVKESIHRVESGREPGDDAHLQRPGPAAAGRTLAGQAPLPLAAPHDQ